MSPEDGHAPTPAEDWEVPAEFVQQPANKYATRRMAEFRNQPEDGEYRDLEMLAGEGSTDPDVVAWVAKQEAQGDALEEWALRSFRDLFKQQFPNATDRDFDDAVAEHGIKFFRALRRDGFEVVDTWASPESSLPPGCDPMTGEPTDAFKALAASFIGREPDDDEQAPPIQFWDAEKTLPRTEEGCVLVLFAGYGQHKTGIATSIGLDVIAAGGTVLCAAGEGRHGFGKNRLPAASAARGITTKDLRGKWHTARRMVNLTDANEVEAFIAAFKGYFSGKPSSLLIIDTLATAKGGVDENSAAFGDLIKDTGPLGRIKRAFGGCTVLVLHHSGKDETKGARGHSSLGGNADGIFAVTHVDKDAGTLELAIEKMRDAEDGFSVEYKITPRGQVPVVSKVGRVQKGSGEATARGLSLTIHCLLAEHPPGTSFTSAELARMTLGLPLAGDLTREQAKAVETRGRALRRLAEAGKVNDYVRVKEGKNGAISKELIWARPGLGGSDV
ncbi:MAG TPA: AAA family ATPase [Stellaceae bacterium]|nr:AAA family ATPase [Stellaceae bacterium]